jgi:hypothetical protein
MNSRAPEDGLPHAGFTVEQEAASIRYELVVRCRQPWGRRVLVIRCYEDETCTACERAAR